MRDMSLQLECHSNIKVIVANGQCIPFLGVFRRTPFSIDGEAFLVDLFTPPLAGYDVMLGTQWFASLGTI